MPLLASGQIYDDFESATTVNWTGSVQGHWTADGTVPLSGLYSLHQAFDNNVAGNDQIAISLNNLRPESGNTTWHFKVRHGYNPSSANNWSCFLMSDSGPAGMAPGGSVNGYALGVNLSGSDDTLRLWKIKNGTVYKVLGTRVNWEKDIGIGSFAETSVERSQEGDWKITIRKGGTTAVWESSGKESELFSPLWFGFYYKYSATGDRLLWIDDVKIEGQFFTDSVPPVLTGSKLTGKNRIVLEFSESPDFTKLSYSDFLLNNGNVSASGLRKMTDTSVEVSFGKDFTNKTENKISITNVCDTSRNCASILTHSFTPVWADRGDVTISEIMADPAPSAGLPEKEFLEITNNTPFSYNLKGWTLVSGNSKIYFPEYIINPSDILILCNTGDTILFKGYGKVIGLKSFPVLTDDGKLLVIYNEYNDLVHGVEYSSGWYGNILKNDGGWSLETVDTGNPFYYEGNWRASVSETGGTPGKPNSVAAVNRDKNCPVVLNVFPDDSVTVTIRFSEPVFIKSEDESAISIDGMSGAQFIVKDLLNREYTFTPGQVLKPRTIYELKLSDDLTDFASNLFCTKEVVFGLPEGAESSELQFNELLFNPYPEGEDYIEFHNCSDKIIDAATLRLYSIDNTDTSALVAVSKIHRCIMPGGYYVITRNRSFLPGYYSTDLNVIYEVSDFIPLDDESGHAVLINDDLEVIDEMRYSTGMYYAILSDFEGIALEKIRPCVLSSETTNWHSASESSGWGTPGLLNSVYTPEVVPDDRISLSSTKITPDNDGFEDLLVIDLHFGNDATVITVVVFDEMGYPVKDLANNLLLGKDDSLTWNGTDNSGSLVDTGIYIIWLSGFDETGKVTKWKKVCTVLRR